MQPSVFGDALTRLWPHGDSKIPGLRAAIVRDAEAVFAKWGLDTDDVICIFMGQMSLECGCGLEVVENLRYTAKRMMAVWPSRFPTLASALPYAGNPDKLAEKVYGSRGGNKPGTGMGAKYIGRGGSQTTFHDGYEALSQVTGLDLLSDPNLVNDPRYFLECAVADFVKCGCLPFAKRGDIECVTHHLNGGLTGLRDRVALTKRWRVAMAVPALEKPADDGVLRYGAKGFEVEAVQNRLVELGYSVGAQDGQFGKATRTAVRAFQDDRGLPNTGEVGPDTKEALKRDLTKPVSEARMVATLADLRATGSDTIVAADKGSLVGVIKMGTGGATVLAALAGKGSEAIDTAQTVVDKGAQAKTLLGSVHDLLGPFASPIVLAIGAVLLVGGYLVWRYSEKVKAARLADHRSATNMGH